MTTSNRHSYSASTIRNGLVAGYSAGICGIVVGHPLDSIKVLLQTSGAQRAASGASASSAATVEPGSHVISRASNGSVANALQQSSSAKANLSTAAVPAHHINNQPATTKRSLRALYAGVSGPLMTVGILQSLNFALYDSVRRVLYQRQLQSENLNGITSGRTDDYLHYDSLSNVAVASFAAGVPLSFLTSPMVIVKTKQQLMVWGFRKAIKETYKNGLSSFYTGFGMHFVCEAVGRSLYMFTYEVLKRELARRKCSEQISHSTMVSTQNLSVPDRMMCAASAGMTCWAFIFPADLVRSRLYAKSLSTQSSLSTWDGILLGRQMVKEQGFRSLYRGVGITVARAGPVAAAVLPVYDSVLEWVSSGC